MSLVRLYCLLCVTFCQYCPGSTQDISLQHIHDLILSMKNNFERLETKVKSLESAVHFLEQENTRKGTNNINSDDIKRKVGSKDIKRSTAQNVIAFSGVITRNFDKYIGKNHVFVYDHLECNIGGAYNKYTGIFTAPTSGVFAFLWTIFAEGRHDIEGAYGEIETELAVNGMRRGYAFTDTEVHNDDDQATGFSIVYLNQGDVVYVRSIGGPQGTFQNSYHGQWTFSGWQIS